MGTLKQTLSYLILGQKGGENRIQIINLLKERPYNLNQMSEILKLNYRTVKHHIEMLLKNDLINSSHTGSYGEVYFLTPQMEGNIDVLDEIIKQLYSSNKLRDFTSSPKFFKNAMEQINDAIIIINSEGHIFFWNESAEKLFGYEKEEIIGENAQIFYEGKTYKRLMTKAKKDEEIIGFETKCKHKSDKVIDVSCTINNIKDENKNLIGFSIISRNISFRKDAEEALKRSEERYALAQRAANIGSWDWNIITGDLEWSDTIEPMFGFDRGKFKKTYEAFLDCVHPEDRQYVMDAVNACVEDEQDYDIEHRIVRPDGKVRTMSETGKVFRDENNKPIRMFGIVQDITDRKRMEERQILTIELLERLNRGGKGKEVIYDIIDLIKEFTGFEAVGIRLNKDGDFPYFVSEGLSKHFIEMENHLCKRDQNNEIIKDSEGNPYLECMCGNVIQGRTNPELPFFTHGGSFWTNSTTNLLATTTEEERQTRTRDRCHGEGYESVALIPLSSGNKNIGLLQLNDKRPDRFSLDIIQFFEGIGTSIGIAFSKMVDEESIKDIGN
jgi:PAS domain S-box-containing protein